VLANDYFELRICNWITPEWLKCLTVTHGTKPGNKRPKTSLETTAENLLGWWRCSAVQYSFFQTRAAMIISNSSVTDSQQPCTCQWLWRHSRRIACKTLRSVLMLIKLCILLVSLNWVYLLVYLLIVKVRRGQVLVVQQVKWQTWNRLRDRTLQTPLRPSPITILWCICISVYVHQRWIVFLVSVDLSHVEPFQLALLWQKHTMKYRANQLLKSVDALVREWLTIVVVDCCCRTRLDAMWHQPFDSSLVCHV